MAAPLPELIADSITEILLRLPPDEPECLVRASLVCKLWRRILSDPTFPQRYREIHRKPPLLGFMCCSYHKAGRFVPVAARVPLRRPPFGCQARDCRHGRVLLDSVGGKKESLAVWDPITGDHRLFRDPEPDSFYRAGVVFCAVAGCDHRVCHDGPFVVVLVSGTHGSTKVSARVYSSDRESSESDDAWSAPASLQLPQGSCICAAKRGVIVEDQFYFLLTDHKILKYDMGKHCLTTIALPCIYTNCNPGILMAMDEGSSLGFVIIKDSTLHLWARNVDPDGSMRWVQDTVDLPTNLVPVIPTTPRHYNVVGFADGVDILLLGDYASGYMFELKSRRFKKLSNPEYHYYDVLPYMSFYIPDFASHKSPPPAKTK